MPTARELLEQADALMRRNRALPPTPRPATVPPAEPRAPFAPSAPVASPRPIQREPIASSVVHTSLPIEDADAVEFAEPLSVARRPDADPAPQAPEALQPRVEAADDPDFPLLTDAVDEPAPRANVPDDDDLPLLTDAVTRIGSVTVDEAGRGEPSLWELTSRGEASVLGPAPDSVIVVPSADTPPAVPQAPRQGRDPLGFDQPAPGFGVPPAPEDGVPAQDPGPAIARGEVDSRRNDPLGDEPSRDDAAYAPSVVDDEAHAYDPEDDEPHVLSAAVAHMPPEDAEEAAVGAGDLPAPDADEPGVEMPSLAGADVAADEATMPDTQAGGLAETGFAATARPEPSPQTEGTTSASAFDQQRIREIAEEIGMQVLQRIDIFTDTTLRAQLGERLRPVVDRAAADLVTAINEHVGELLRAQVAEAIEREIESWKSGGR